MECIEQRRVQAHHTPPSAFVMPLGATRSNTQIVGQKSVRAQCPAWTLKLRSDSRFKGRPTQLDPSNSTTTSISQTQTIMQATTATHWNQAIFLRLQERDALEKQHDAVFQRCEFGPSLHTHLDHHQADCRSSCPRMNRSQACRANPSTQAAQSSASECGCCCAICIYLGCRRIQLSCRLTFALILVKRGG